MVLLGFDSFPIIVNCLSKIAGGINQAASRPGQRQGCSVGTERPCVLPPGSFYSSQETQGNPAGLILPPVGPHWATPALHRGRAWPSSPPASFLTGGWHWFGIMLPGFLIKLPRLQGSPDRELEDVASDRHWHFSFFSIEPGASRPSSFCPIRASRRGRSRTSILSDAMWDGGGDLSSHPPPSPLQRLHYVIVSDKVLGGDSCLPAELPQEHLRRGDVSKPECQLAVVSDAQENRKRTGLLPHVSLLIAFICVRSSLWTSYSAYSYFEVVTVCNLIMILAFYLVHLFRLYRVLTCISWPLSELLHYLIGTLLLLIASIVAASKSYSQSRLVAGAIFGFLATFLCLASVWLSYKISCVTQSTDAAV
eukprot:bmy_20068T0